MTSRLPLRLALALASAAAAWVAPGAARAQEAEVLHQALRNYNEGRNREAAIGFYRVEEASTVPDRRAKAEYYLAQSLARQGLSFSSFFYDGQIIKAGPSHPWYLKAIEGAVSASEAYRDEVLAPNLLDKAYDDRFGKLPPETLAKVNASIALLDFRAGKYDEAAQFLQGVPPESAAFAQAQYLNGLLQQRKDPEKALRTFRNLVAMEGARYRDLKDLQEVAHLALGRTLYALGRFAEASAEYAKLPRFSRHWDEALFEGAYADLLNDDPGGALGKLHSLHSPHLSDEFAPESQNLAAIIYHQHCLYPQVREVIARFNRDYVPMKEALKSILDSNPAPDRLWQMVAQGNDRRLPVAVQHHLLKNERVEAMLGYLARLDAEAAAIRKDDKLARDALGVDLLDLIGRQRTLLGQVAGKFIRGRLVDLARLIDVLDADKEIIGFETTKGEKEQLDQNVDVHGLLASQKLSRPAMPETGHEYWPFDGEYWPDEIGYYRYTLKNACAPRKRDE